MTSFSFEKNISSLEQLINRFLQKDFPFLWRSIYWRIKIYRAGLLLLVSESLTSHLSPLTTVQTVEWGLPGGRSSVVSWLRDEKESRWGWGRTSSPVQSTPPPSHNQLLILSGGSEWLRVAPSHHWPGQEPCQPGDILQHNHRLISPSARLNLSSETTEPVLPITIIRLQLMEKAREQDRLF